MLTFFGLALALETIARGSETAQPGRYSEVVWFALLYGIPVGYLLLVVPAAAAGFVIGRWQAAAGRLRWWQALAIGALTGLAVHLMIGQWLLPGRGNAGYLAGQELVPAAAFALGTLAAWSVVRNWNVAPQASGATR
jgi:hypothetical protein